VSGEVACSSRQASAWTLSQGNPATRAMVEAPAVLVLCGKQGISGSYKGQVTTKLGDWFMFDLGLATQAGDIDLLIPKLRAGSFFPSILEPRRRVDQALYAVIMEA
jgi:hypothetical protein